MSLKSSSLGQMTSYPKDYSPDLLYRVPRIDHRGNLGLSSALPFQGEDIWTAYELSWLNSRGKPQIAVATLRVPCDSPYLIESKSMKLYFFSLNQTKFENPLQLQQTIARDLSQAAGAQVGVQLIMPSDFSQQTLQVFEGICLDHLDIQIDAQTPQAELLSCDNEQVEEAYYSHLVRSHCPITQQPDWASILIRYKGKKIRAENLLRYLISFRLHHEFHEHCVEKIFVDLLNSCAPEQLTVYARFTRRGGLDINPFRSNFEPAPLENRAHFRQ